MDYGAIQIIRDTLAQGGNWQKLVTNKLLVA